MTYSISPLFCRPWTLNGIQPRLIESHYEHNYGAAVRRLNAVTAELTGLDIASVAPQVLGRLKREQTSLLNSTLLHELYFASLGGDGRAVPASLSTALARDFGSVDQLPVPGQVAQHDPARFAAQRFGQCHELLAPAIDRSEVSCKRGRQARRDGSPIAAQAGEVKLVQQS